MNPLERERRGWRLSKICKDCLNRHKFGNEEWCMVFCIPIDEVDWEDCEFKRKLR